MSPYWDREFEQAVAAGAIEKPPPHVSLGGSWSSLTEGGEASNLNLVRPLPSLSALSSLLLDIYHSAPSAVLMLCCPNGCNVCGALCLAGAHARLRPTECR